MSLTFLDRFRPRPAAAVSPVFEGLPQVRAYWEALRPVQALPARGRLDPRGLAGMLDRVFLAERIGHGLAQIRIGGSALAGLAGTELRGLPLSCLFAAESRALLAQGVERVMAEPAIVELDLGSDRDRPGQTRARILLLPLAEPDGSRSLLGALSCVPGFDGPCRFQILSRREERVALPLAPEDPAPVIPIRQRRHLALVHFSE